MSQPAVPAGPEVVPGSPDAELVRAIDLGSAILFIPGSAAFVLNTLFERPVQLLIGIGLLPLGLPAYWDWRKA